MSGKCRDCAQFRNDPAYLEAALRGMNVMSSAWGSTRAEDGLCLRHEGSPEGIAVAGLVLDDERPPEHRLEVVRHQPRRCIRRPAGGGRHNDAHETGGPVLC